MNIMLKVASSPAEELPKALARQHRSQEKRSNETRSALIEATISMLCELGYAGTNLADVARRASCTTGAMQHHFGSKEELMRALVVRIAAEFEETYAVFSSLVGLPLRERCARVVSVLAAYYSAPRYVAIWELYVGSRCEPTLNDICVASRAAVVVEIERVWLKIFVDVPASRQDVLALLDYTLTFLRNFGLNRSLGTASRSPLRQLTFLEDTLLLNLEAHETRRPGELASGALMSGDV